MSSITGMGAIPGDVWASIFQTLSNSEVCSLSASSRACWLASCDKRSLKVELDADENMQNRLASLLFFLTSRRKHLKVDAIRSSKESVTMLAVALIGGCSFCTPLLYISNELTKAPSCER